MATEYFSDQESSIAANSLAETPFMTPQPSRSRRSSRHGTPSSLGDLSQASPVPPASDCTSDDPANDENISMLDPRRFTPTLHANLVAEILNLRRELDSKHRVIEDLETNLHSTQEENEVLNDKLSSSLRESRNARRQIQQLETGTLSALEELAKERDQFKADNEQLKSKLEASQKKAKSEGDASDRTQDLWQKTLVQRTETLLLRNKFQSGPRPAVLGNTARNLRAVLYSALDDIHWSVEDGTDSASNGTRDEIVSHLDRLVLRRVRRQESADLEDAAKVTAVPEDVAPCGGLKALVEGPDTLLTNDLLDAVEHAVVLGCLCLVWDVVNTHGPGQRIARSSPCNRILTSSNGTTTKASVAPAEAPVRMESDWFILATPNRFL